MQIHKNTRYRIFWWICYTDGRKFTLLGCSFIYSMQFEKRQTSRMQHNKTYVNPKPVTEFSYQSLFVAYTLT